MSKKRPRYRQVSRPLAPGPSPVATRWWSDFYSWSGLPFAPSSYPWLVGLGLITLLLLLLGQISLGARLSYRLYYLEVEHDQTKEAIEDGVQEISKLKALDSTQRWADGWVPVEDPTWLNKANE